MERGISVERLRLGTVQLPDWHPRAAEATCTIDGFVIRHPDGPILVDTGVGDDNEILNEIYQPTVVPVVEALNAVGIDERDLAAVVNTHLHFDHCGQNRAFPTVPVYVQAAELAAIKLPGFTIAEWASVPTDQVRIVDGDADLAEGVRLVATPGHTPGHQSVVVDGDGTGPTIIVGQCCYTCAEFESGTLLDADMHDESYLDVGAESLNRLRSLRPSAAFFSHDRTPLSRNATSAEGRDA